MKKKFKIANIIEEGFLGGPQKRIINTCNFLNKKFETTVILPSKNSNKFEDLLIANNIKYKLLNINKLSLNFFLFLKYILFFFIDILKIYFYLKKNNFDIVHISGGAWQIKGVIAAKLNKNKICWQLNDTYLPYILRIQFKLLHLLADKFIYSSYKTKKYYSNIINENHSYSIIPSGVNTQYFNPNLEYQLDKNQEKLFKNKFVVGMVANINPIKGIEDFLMIANEFKKNSELNFVLVCQVPLNQIKLFNKFIKMKKDYQIHNFYFLKSTDDIRTILNKVNLYLCLSNSESSPVAVWEALSMEKAILSYDVGDVAKYVINNLNGKIIDRSIKSAVSNINELYNDKIRLRKFSKESRIIAKKELDISFSANKLNNLYDSLLLNIVKN